MSDLQATSPVPVDYSLLHEGGCTCDDTELPHHISSNSQISVLVDCVQDVVSHLKKPTIVTVARWVNLDLAEFIHRLTLKVARQHSKHFFLFFLLTVLVSTIYNSQVFFMIKNVSSFFQQKY